MGKHHEIQVKMDHGFPEGGAQPLWGVVEDDMVFMEAIEFVYHEALLATYFFSISLSILTLCLNNSVDNSDCPPNFKVTKGREFPALDGKSVSTAISAFHSANAGTVSVPTTVFASEAFKTAVAGIQKLKAGLFCSVVISAHYVSFHSRLGHLTLNISAYYPEDVERHILKMNSEGYLKTKTCLDFFNGSSVSLESLCQNPTINAICEQSARN
ncbi:hypothetical protein SADUNF_Sadunf10G0187400 [Salix dunnii]|uniref:Uncharacterized protein n=1 Tax=Salix dunnii TaxID=1413687 RepID=A0A835JS34_9ROSI|nr:hypothetical protein SADUNF_Sadunf10G0187400 [Salix dunnii]